jgi:hypothetical protein
LREGDEGTKEGSVWVTTRVGTYLNDLSAVDKHFEVGMVERREADIGAGVARMTCLNGPNVEVGEYNVYRDLVPVRWVMLVERCNCVSGTGDMRAETTALNPCGEEIV